MKNIFRRKSAQDDNWEGYDESYDWDAPEEEYYEEGTYEEDAYTDEVYEEEVYVDSEAPSGEVYYEDEYYEGEESYYEEEAYYEEEEPYYEEEEPYYEEEFYEDNRPSHPGNPFVKLWNSFVEVPTMDKVMMFSGLLVLILALVTGGVYLSSKSGADSADVFAEVGGELDTISLIGERGLIAIADAQLAKQTVAEIVDEEEQEQKDYDEAELTKDVAVKLNMTSVLKDLKIKFVNKSTGKLISNVPFKVEITTPDGKTEEWQDDDKDGIIYKKKIAAGTYKVLVEALDGEKYEKYSLPSDKQSVDVKGEIAYEKIDVSDEVKTEAEIDVAKEDTQVNDTVVESTLQDTVTYVDSTETANTYLEVPKSEIPDPMTLALHRAFLRIAQEQSTVTGGDATVGNAVFTLALSANEASVKVGASATAKANVTGASEGVAISYSTVSANSGIATASVDASGNVTITGVTAGTTQITVNAEYAAGEKQTKSASINVTVTGDLALKLDKTALTVYLTAPVNMNISATGGSAAAQITAVSSNTNVATVAVNGNVMTITGVAVGDATVTVQYSEPGGTPVQAACAVKVLTHPKDNKTDQLKDAKGRLLFVEENGKYREAVYADYYTASKFYVKGEVKYTGWQTLEGKVYFFTATGEKVTGDQVIQGAKYHFASDGSLVVGSGTMGIDVSKWNGNIDWKAVKNSGVSYVIIRCGYRGSSQGMLVQDPKFKNNISGAIAADIKVGVYFFTQAVDEVEAVEEASFVLDMIKGYKISYPVFLDVEVSGGRGDKIDKDTRTAVCKTFCETIKRAGYTAGVYANKSWFEGKIDASALGAYKIWLAQYAQEPTYKGRYDMWQYRSTGKVSGISGNVDLNLSYLGY